jgi:hypothetical protein
MKQIVEAVINTIPPIAIPFIILILGYFWYKKPAKTDILLGKVEEYFKEGLKKIEGNQKEMKTDIYNLHKKIDTLDWNSKKLDQRVGELEKTKIV